MADAKKIVRIDYKAYFADADRLYDTTNADAAKEAGIFNEKVTYAPMAYIVGSGSLYADLDAAIAGAEVGKEVEVTIPCEKAAGARNPRLIELHPIKEFYKSRRQEPQAHRAPPHQGVLQERDQPLPRHVRQPRQPQRCRHVRRSRPRQGRLQQPPGRPRPEVRGHRRRGGHRPRREGQVHHGDGLRNLRGIRIRHHGGQGRRHRGRDLQVPRGDKVVVTEAEICKFHEGWAVAKYKLVSDYRATFGVDRVEFVQVWESKKADAPAAE